MDINELHDALKKAVEDFEINNRVKVARIHIVRESARLFGGELTCGPVSLEIEVAG
jgi:hypothetical protein